MSPAAVLLAYDPNDVKPGWVALILVIVLAGVTFLLWRSMNTQLRRISAPHKADLDKQVPRKPESQPESQTGSEQKQEDDHA